MSTDKYNSGNFKQLVFKTESNSIDYRDAIDRIDLRADTPKFDLKNTSPSDGKNGKSKNDQSDRKSEKRSSSLKKSPQRTAIVQAKDTESDKKNSSGKKMRTSSSMTQTRLSEMIIPRQPRMNFSLKSNNKSHSARYLKSDQQKSGRKGFVGKRKWKDSLRERRKTELCKVEWIR